MKRKLLKNLKLAGLGMAAAAGIAAENANAQILYTETFDGLTLQGSVNERLGPGNVTRVASDPDSVPYANAFAKSDPSVSGVDGSSWQIDNTLGQYDGVISLGYSPSPTTGNSGVPGAGLPNYGVNEWEGWSFAHKDFWTTADKQGRETFTLGSGVVAVADADEYFDLGDTDDPVNGGYFNTALKSPSIAVTGDGGTFYTLKYDSSWRDESFDDDYGPNAALNSTNNQSVEILAVFDNGVTQVIEGWDSAGPTNPATPQTFKNDAQNETLIASFLAPAGANSVRLHFNYANAANDWWWAIDNLELENANTTTQVWTENFEDVALNPSENERLAFTAKQTVAEATPNTLSRPDSFTHDAPAGWTVDNSGIPAAALGQNDIGVYEWEGWSFAPRTFWNFADTQGRQEFTKCTGNCAIADSDEWTDLGNTGGALDTVLVSPAIDISAVKAGGLRLSFDSSWIPEDAQTALLTVDYGDGNGPQQVMLWESNEFLDPEETVINPNFHGRNTNETVNLSLANPAGANTATFRFAHLDGNNNWWWAVDNIQVSAVPEPSTCFMAFVAVIGIAAGSRRRD